MYNSYIIKARILPSIISMGMPIFVFNHFFLSTEFSNFVADVFKLKIISNVTISLIFLLLLSEIGRFLGKFLFEDIYFKEEYKMPTTTFLLFKDKNYSDEYKNKIRTKILDDFKLSLSTRTEENNNEKLARKRIIEAMGLIRGRLHGNKFLLQHNIEYGTMRNLIGGAVLGIIFSIFNIIFFSLYFKNPLAIYISIFTLFIYACIIFFSKTIMRFYSNRYTKILYREYLGSTA